VDASYFSTRFLKSQTSTDVLATDDFRLHGSPYPGLRSFSPQEGSFFFGRDRSVNEIRDRLADLHIAVVLGGSGSGKSSIVRAGLIPRLNSTKGIKGRSGNWYAAEFRPRLRPMDEMAEALGGLVSEQFPNQGPGPEGNPGKPDAEATTARLKVSFKVKPREQVASPAEHREIQASSFCDALFDFVAAELDQRDRSATKGLRSGRPNLLLLVDQFEEIFRPEVASEPTSGGSQFLDLLLATYSRLEREQRGPPEARSGLFIVLTMRSEELHRCTEHPSLTTRLGTETLHRSLADMVNRSAYLLDLLDPVQDREALREAIIYPARRMFQDWGLSLSTSNPDAPFGPGVPDWLIKGAQRLSRELEHRPDELPLLQHALQTMWQSAVADWASVTNQHDFIIHREHLLGPLVEDNLVANGPDLSACLDERANDAAREADIACDKSLTTSGIEKFTKLSIPRDTQLGPGRVATRAAFRALAQRDDRGHWVRRFASLQRIIVFMQADPSTGELHNKARETYLRIALDSFVAQGYLVEKKGQYDISHEALIRNWKLYQEWLRQPEEVAQTITRLVSDINPAELEEASGEVRRQLLFFNFPAPVRDKLGAIFGDKVLPMDWAMEQIIPLIKRPTIANRWVSATCQMHTDKTDKDKIAAKAILHRLWRFVEETRRAQKRFDEQLKHQTRVKKIAAAAVSFAFLAAIGGYIVQHYAAKRAFVEKLISFALRDSSPNFRERILLLLYALDESKGLKRFFSDPYYPRTALRSLLLRTPNLGGTYTAVGSNNSGTKLAILNEGELTVHDLSTQTSTLPLKVVWPSRESTSVTKYRQAPFEPYVAGFIDSPDKKDNPAVYHEGILIYWDEKGSPHPFDVLDLLPPSFARGNFRAGELMNTLRFTMNVRSDIGSGLDTRFFELALRKDGNGLTLKPASSAVEEGWAVPSWGIRFTSTISPQCDLYGYLDNQRETRTTQSLFIGQLGRTDPPMKVDLGTAALQDDVPGSNFVRSISFSSDCAVVSVRESLERVRLFPIDATNGNIRFDKARSVHFIVPQVAQDVVHPLFFRLRPLMASSRTDEGYRFAWLTREGIVVLDLGSGSEPEQQARLFYEAPILTGLDNGAKLQFSRNGKFLILIQQSWGSNSRTKVRVWEIGESLDRIPEAGDELTAEACRVAMQESGKAALEIGESIRWFDENRASPCEAFTEAVRDRLLPHR
jgi:hypothetical protein